MPTSSVLKQPVLLVWPAALLCYLKPPAHMHTRWVSQQKTHVLDFSGMYYQYFIIATELDWRQKQGLAESSPKLAEFSYSTVSL